ncbi:hypothetical protein [Chryseobacterium taklimakanense]|uniref:hypothetical protein n=1 Tax=Chryseobacterium taklimakanense TaxID=536441 RepID=UPI0023F9F383|nr:hypothetical protein [Chryseobacterium taklimakanense]
MKRILICSIIALAAVSCNKKTETSNVNSADSLGVFTEEESVADSTLAATTGCYMQVTGNDTLFAQIDDNLGTVTGKLHYKNHQKDSSFGDLLGSSVGDTIKVDYTFQSEGSLSTREIWFLKKDGKLLEGIGPFDKTGEKYANYKNIKFGDGHVLDAVDCKKIANKFREVTVSSNLNAVPSVPVKVADTKSDPKEETKTTPKAEEKKEAKTDSKTAEKTAAKKTEPKKAESKTK